MSLRGRHDGHDDLVPDAGTHTTRLDFEGMTPEERAWLGNQVRRVRILPRGQFLWIGAANVMVIVAALLLAGSLRITKPGAVIAMVAVPVILLDLVVVVLFSRRVKHRVAERLLAIGRCPACGYRVDLPEGRDVVGCPECGRPYYRNEYEEAARRFTQSLVEP